MGVRSYVCCMSISTRSHACSTTMDQTEITEQRECTSVTTKKARTMIAVTGIMQGRTQSSSRRSRHTEMAAKREQRLKRCKVQDREHHTQSRSTKTAAQRDERLARQMEQTRACHKRYRSTEKPSRESQGWHG